MTDRQSLLERPPIIVNGVDSVCVRARLKQRAQRNDDNPVCVTGAQLASYKLTRCWGGASGAVAVACDGGDASARKARRGQRRAARRALKEMEAAAKARAADRRAGGGASKATGWGGQRSGGGGSGGVGGGGGLLAAAGTAAARSLVHAGG